MPSESTQEVATRNQEAVSKLPLPDFLTMRGPYWYTSEGIQHAFMLYEFDRSRLADAYDHLVTYIRMFVGIPGFKREIKICSEQADVQRTTPPA
jgi:hypothetical protein